MVDDVDDTKVVPEGEGGGPSPALEEALLSDEGTSIDFQEASDVVAPDVAMGATESDGIEETGDQDPLRVSEVSSSGHSAEGDVNTAGGNVSTVGRDKIDDAGDVTIDNSVNNTFATEQPTFEPVSPTSIAKLTRVFVKPHHYGALLQDLKRRLQVDSNEEDSRGDEGQRQQERRVVLVHGPDHSGKWACAVNLAVDLAKTPGVLPLPQEGATTEDYRPWDRVLRYGRPRESEIPLASAVSKFPERSIVLLQDCFERNVRLGEIEGSEVDDLTEILFRKKSLLILTGALASDSPMIAKLKAKLTEGRLHRVLRSHVDYLIETEELLESDERVDLVLEKELWARLSNYLKTPYHVDQFCSALPAASPEIKAEGLIRIARQRAAGGMHAARTWFDGLKPNERLHALLIYLFSGAERRWIEALGREMISRLFSDGCTWLSDPLAEGSEDVRERIHAVEEGGRLEFKEQIYEQELRRQVGNRQHLLWEMLEPLVEFDPRDGWSEAWKRHALGVALGKVGEHDLARLEKALDAIASDSEWSRAVVPGHAFHELVRQDSRASRAFVFGRIQSWISSKDHCLQWSAGAALWRVYRAVSYNSGADASAVVVSAKNRVLDLLRLLVFHVDNIKLPDSQGREDKKRREKEKQGYRNKNLSCVVEAMRQLVLIDAGHAAGKLNVWLENGTTDLKNVAKWSVRAIFATMASEQRKPSQEQRGSLLSFVPPLLSVASDESRDVQTMVLTLRGWLRWPGVAEQVGLQLLEFATYEGAQVRERLRSSLSRFWLVDKPIGIDEIAEQLTNRNSERLVAFWCEDNAEEAHRIARNVITRCYAVDGALPGPPRMGRGTIVFDPVLWHQPVTEGRVSNAFWRVLAHLDSRVDVALLPLGHDEPLQEASPVASEASRLGSWLPSVTSFPRHSLLLPGLENLEAGDREDVFVLSTCQPHDLADLLEQPWLRSLHYLAPAAEGFSSMAEESERWTHLPVDWPPTGHQLDAAMSSIDDSWAQTLASAPPDRWIELLGRAFDVQEVVAGSPQSHVELLAGLADALETPQMSLRSQDDPIWRGLVLSLWMAASDLECCLRWIASWLLADAHRPRRVMASAAAYALIRLHTAFPAHRCAGHQAPAAIFEHLAWPLGRYGREGVEAIVRLVEHWFEVPAWAEYLVGDTIEGRGRLDRWVMEFLEDRPELANRLRRRLNENRAEADSSRSWTVMTAALDRLDAVRALEHPRSLPNLQEGQRYLGLVFDAGAGNGGLSRHLAGVTSALYKELSTGTERLLVPVVYRFGERRPFWADVAESPPPNRLMALGMRPPSLVGPLLQSLEWSRTDTEALLLITGGEPADLEDWKESDWWRKVYLYAGDSRPRSPTFAAVPQPLKHQANGGGTEIFEAEQLAIFFRDRLDADALVEDSAQPRKE